MKEYRFTFALTGVPELTPDLADALYEAAGGDIECQQRADVTTVEFVRQAESLDEAIAGATAAVESARPGVHVVRVRTDSSAGRNE